MYHHYGNLDNPGADSAYILDGAINIKENGKYDNTFLYRFDIYDGVDRHTIIKPAYHFMPLTSLLLAGVLAIHNSIFATIVFQYVIFLFIIHIYFSWIKESFDVKTAFVSSLILVFNPLIYSEIIQPVRTHIIGLLTILLFFYIYQSKLF